LSGRGLCYELITRPEESYRLCCVVVCDLETSRMGAPYIYDISRLRFNAVYTLTYLLTPCSTVLLDKLSGCQLVNKFPAFYRTRRFITAFTRPATCPHPESDQSRPCPPPRHPFSWISTFMFSSHLRLGLPSGHFFLGFPHQNPVCTSPLPPYGCLYTRVTIFLLLWLTT